MSAGAHRKENVGLVLSRAHPSSINPEPHSWATKVANICIPRFIAKYINECLPRFHLARRMLLLILLHLKLNFVRTATCRGQCICGLFLCPYRACKKQNNEECLDRGFSLRFSKK